MNRWKNTKEMKSKWDEHASSSPYRASVGEDVEWDSNRPYLNLASAVKASSKGDRLLLCFELKEVRDYFVEGHREGGVMIEPDHAEDSIPRLSSTSPQMPRTFEDLKNAVLTLSKLEREGVEDVGKTFIDEIRKLLSEGKIEEALGITQSIHADCVVKIMAMDTIKKNSPWNFKENPLPKFSPTPFTRERAAAMLKWLKAHLDHREAEDELEKIALPMAREILDREGNEAVAKFNETIPPGITRAFIADLACYGTPRSTTNEEGIDNKMKM